MSTSENEVAALREQIADLKGIITSQAERIEQQAGRIEEQANRIDLLLEERAEDRQRIAELEEYRAENEHDKATIRQQVTEVEQTDSSADAESDDSDAQSDSMSTPMEQVLRAGDAGVLGHVTTSVERAITMAEHFSQWADKAPNGLVIKDNLKTLLETATGERFAWNQVYRAAEALEDATNGAIEFTKHRRFGWILVGDPQVVTKLSRASSVGER